MQQAIARLSKTLQAMELNICDSILRGTSEVERAEAILEDTHKTVDALTEAKDVVTSSLCSHLIQQNTAKRGVIAWVKSGASRNFNPEPLLLREALQFLALRESYSSTGYDIYDIFEKELDEQYDIIMKLVSMVRKDKKAYESMTSTPATLSLKCYSALKTKYRSIVDEVSPDVLLTKEFKKLENNSKNIITTALQVFSYLVDQNWKARGTNCE